MNGKDREIVLDKIRSIGDGGMLIYKNALGFADDVDMYYGGILMFVIKSNNPWIEEGNWILIKPWGVRYNVLKVDFCSYPDRFLVYHMYE